MVETLSRSDLPKVESPWFRPQVPLAEQRGFVSRAAQDLRDIWRYRCFVKLWAIIVIVTGFVLLGIDMTAGMPTSWIIGEGPPTIVVGLIVLWLQRKITVASDDHHES